MQITPRRGLYTLTLGSSQGTGRSRGSLGKGPVRVWALSRGAGTTVGTSLLSKCPLLFVGLFVSHPKKEPLRLGLQPALRHTDSSELCSGLTGHQEGSSFLHPSHSTANPTCRSRPFISSPSEHSGLLGLVPSSGTARRQGHPRSQGRLH